MVSQVTSVHVLEYLQNFSFLFTTCKIKKSIDSKSCCIFFYKDPDDPEYQRQLQRPAEVKEDMNQMEARQRVSLILESKAFRDELEMLVKEQMAQGGNPASLRALQQIADYILPGHKLSNNISKGKLHVVKHMCCQDGYSLVHI